MTKAGLIDMGKGRTPMLARMTGAAALALALSGCLSLGGASAPGLLVDLTPAETAKAGATVSGKAADAVMVLEPETDRRLAVLRIPVQVSGSQVAYLSGAQWVDRPARLFEHLLAETLRARGGRLVLEDGQSAGTPGVRLSGRLSEMGYDARSRSVVVLFDALRTDAAGQVITRRFESRVADVAPKATAIGPALGRAANDVAAQVADWMGG